MLAFMCAGSVCAFLRASPAPHDTLALGCVAQGSRRAVLAGGTAPIASREPIVQGSLTRKAQWRASTRKSRR